MSDSARRRLMDVALSLHWLDTQCPGCLSMDAGMDASVMATVPDAVHLHAEGALDALTRCDLLRGGLWSRAAAYSDRTKLAPRAAADLFLLWRLERERHYDLLAEVLLCWDLVGKNRHSPPYRPSLDMCCETSKTR